MSVHCRWPLIRGNLTLKCVGWGIDNVAVQGRWPLTTGVAQGRYYCINSMCIIIIIIIIINACVRVADVMTFTFVSLMPVHVY